MKKHLTAAIVIALSLANVSKANWDQNDSNRLDIAIAKYNAVSRVTDFLSEKTGQDVSREDYVSKTTLESTDSKENPDALPATFEVVLFARQQDGTAGREVIQAEVHCQRGQTRQESRFTRVTPIDCTVVRTF